MKKVKQTTKSGYQEKVSALSFKADTESRKVKGYFSAFNVIDSDADVILAGAFTKSIQEHGPNSTSNRKIAHLAFHDTRRPVGTINVLEEDEKGLYFESTLGTHTDAEDAMKMYNEMTIREHSIGFQYIPKKMKFVEVEESEIEKVLEIYPNSNLGAVKSWGGYFEISEVKLFEGSYVTFGANPETPNETLKTQDQIIEDFAKYQQQLWDEIKKFDSDGMTEQKFLQFCSRYKSLLNPKPSVKDTLKEEAEKKQKTKNNFYSQLIKS